MILLSLHPGPPSETSAFRRMRAFSSRLAGPLPLGDKALHFPPPPPPTPPQFFFTRIFFPSHDPPRRSNRGKSESSNPFKLVEAGDMLRICGLRPKLRGQKKDTPSYR